MSLVGPPLPTCAVHKVVSLYEELETFQSNGRHSCFCRVGPGNFTPSLSQIPDVILSHDPARAIARRLPPSAEIAGSSRFDPVGPRSTTMTPLRSMGIGCSAAAPLPAAFVHMAPRNSSHHGSPSTPLPAWVHASEARLREVTWSRRLRSTTYTKEPGGLPGSRPRGSFRLDVRFADGAAKIRHTVCEYQRRNPRHTSRLEGIAVGGVWT
jgi:hypothetical protein